jgi:outer membrane protein insertion porin family
MILSAQQAVFRAPAHVRVTVRALVLSLCLGFGCVGIATAQVALDEVPGAEADAAAGGEAIDEEIIDEEIEETRIPIAVLPFRIYSARPLSYLTESLSDLLAARLEATGKVTVLGSQRVSDALDLLEATELSEEDLRSLAERLEVRAVLSGSITELAGRFSLDVRLTPAGVGRSESIAIIAQNEEALIGRLDELADRSVASLSGTDPDQIIEVVIEAAGEIEAELRETLEYRAGEIYEPAEVRRDRARIEDHPAVARVTLDVERGPSGIRLVYRVIRSERLFGSAAREREGADIGDIYIRGNRRIDSDAILGRISSQVGAPLNETQVAGDIRSIFELGFFGDVRAYVDSGPTGKILIFDVFENPVVRQISISGNENIDGEKVTEILTLTTGSTLDRSLLKTNTERIKALYRAEGYYLAEAGFTIENIAEGSVAVHFEVEENEKLRLKKVQFSGNDAFTNSQLSEDFATKLWKPWSYLTSWYDRSGTYSEPVFMRDLRGIEKKYSDDGYLQVEISDPVIDASEDGLVVHVAIREGPQFDVGDIKITGDDSMDFNALLAQLDQETGEIFNRSSLTEDVEVLERHYTDRGFYFASVRPATRLDPEARKIDVEFQVKKGPLYFIRQIDISGNTTTVDPVIRRELKLVEGQLYSARDLKISNSKVRSLGYFEDVAFEPTPTDDPSQLDLNVTVAERPTGSFSFGAGFSSQDKLVFTAALSQANLFGRGYAVNLQVDLGGRTSRYNVSIRDPHFLDTDFSASFSLFLSEVNFEDFKQRQRGFDLSLGHALREDNTAHGFVRYSYSERKVEQDSGVNASAPVFRQILQGNNSSSLMGLSARSDTRNDRFSPTDGTVYGGTLEVSGLGGFAKYVRLEGRSSWYLGAPDFLFDRSSFVLSTRIGYTYSFNTLSDFDFQEVEGDTVCDDGACDNAAPLDEIDENLTLPLTERYFLGGIGAFQLRGYKARTVGPRRAILYRTNPFDQSGGKVFTPVGRRFDETTLKSPCEDEPLALFNTQGNNNGKCNNIDDERIEDFDDLDETDVVGGNKFVLTNLEYRFPLSEEVGLQAVLFVDGGNAYAEGQNLFDVTDWRYAYGGGLLWFSPFGPLQIVLGFPIDPLSVEKSPVFEFSVGGFVQ